ncbi:MAG: hypothetical protein IPK16_19065 [Anaerolineales bacterium]|nr:hypothetical protein [Anaerolineales bacterium]
MISQGNTTTPYTFTLVVTNTNPITPTAPISFVLQLPAGFFFVGNSAAAQGKLNGILQLQQPVLDTTAGEPVTITVVSPPPANVLAPNDVITLTYRLAAGTNGLPNPTITNTLMATSTVLPLCTVGTVVNTSHCPLAVRLPTILTIPPYIVSRGNSAGDIYTTTVRNTGTTTVTDLGFAFQPSTGFFLVGGSAAGVHSTYGVLSVAQSPINTAPAAPFVAQISNPYPANTLAPGATVTLTLRLGTDADARSGQPLSVTVRSGLSAVQDCSTTRANVPTGRGNLVIAKAPQLQQAGFGEVVTWTVQVRNTGLGNVYNASFLEAPGAGVQILSVTPMQTTTAVIPPDQHALYTVTGQVNSCSGLANAANGWWSIGNIDGRGVITDPVSDAAYLEYRFEDPVVSVAVQPVADLEFCGQPERTVAVTLTNSGGAAAAIRLATVVSGTFVITPVSGGWVQAREHLQHYGHQRRSMPLVRSHWRCRFATPPGSAGRMQVQFTRVHLPGCLPNERTG